MFCTLEYGVSNVWKHWSVASKSLKEGKNCSYSVTVSGYTSHIKSVSNCLGGLFGNATVQGHVIEGVEAKCGWNYDYISLQKFLLYLSRCVCQFVWQCTVILTLFSYHYRFSFPDEDF